MKRPKRKIRSVDPEIDLRIGCWTTIKGVKCTICARHNADKLYRYVNINTRFAICHGCSLLMLFDLIEQTGFYPEFGRDLMQRMNMKQSAALGGVTSITKKRLRSCAEAMSSRYRTALMAIKDEFENLDEFDKQASQLDY